MNPSSSRVLPTVLLLAPLVAGALSAQKRDKSPLGGTPLVEVVRDLDDAPELATALTELEDVWGEDPGSEAELRGVRGVVRRAEGKLSKGDAQQIVQALRKVLGQGRLVLPERDAVYRAAVDGLARFGELGGDVLLRTYEGGRIPTRPDTQRLRGHLLVALPKTGHRKVPKLLIDTVRGSSESQLMADAGRAMQDYAEAPRAQRQEFVEALARRMAGLENVASRRPGDPGRFRDLGREDAEDDLNAVREVWNPTLAKLTGERHRTGQAWWSWYQDNRSRSWPADPKREGRGRGAYFRRG